MQLSDFHFELPSAAIAQYPLVERSESRLLCLSQSTKQLNHSYFNQIVALIEPGDLVVLNNTKVLPARMYGYKETGGKVEILVERLLPNKAFLAQIRVSKPPKIGDRLYINTEIFFEVVGKKDNFYHLSYSGTNTIEALLKIVGEVPLPPYMHRKPTEADFARYQTVYAKETGSVAAPTAGLHFDEALLLKLRKKGVHLATLTLHIGAGTFAPVRVNNIKEHKMHAEYIHVSQALCDQINATKAQGKRVIAVGTTSLRALETAAKEGGMKPYEGDTNIFIYPGYQFMCVDALITNFHLPSSTLLMLVCAFGGYEFLMRAYQEAVKMGYRFYSYGDAMWIERAIVK